MNTVTSAFKVRAGEECCSALSMSSGPSAKEEREKARAPHRTPEKLTVKPVLHPQGSESLLCDTS